MSNRIKKLRAHLKKNDLFPYLVCDLINIRYLSGFAGSSAYLVLGQNFTLLLSDSRYEEYARSILPDSVEFVLQKGDIATTLKEELKNRGMKTLHIEEHSIVLSLFMSLKKSLRGIKLVPAGDLVNELRMIKDQDEIAILRKAAALTDDCVTHLGALIKPGIVEWDIAVEIEYFYRKNGCHKESFDAIVASGKGTSMPHYQTSMKKKIETGDAVLIDMGCQLQGYNSDLTRTLFVGSIDRSLEKIYSIVREAQEAAIGCVKPGITTGKLDSIARDIISDCGYGEYFGHSLGHGLGLEVHELPAVKAGDTKLKKNMVITVEPGIYVPGTGGVRIEDMVLVTDKSCEILTKSSKDIILL